MNSTSDNNDRSTLVDLTRAAPQGDLDLAAIRARGTQLRNRRRALTAGVALASAALVAGGVLTINQPELGLEPAGPAASSTGTPSTAVPEQPSTEPDDVESQSPPQQDPSDGDTSSANPFDVSGVEQLADQHDMLLERADEIAPGLFDLALVDDAGTTYAASVADASTPADGRSQLEMMTTDRGYYSIVVDGADAFRSDPTVAGDSVDYALLSADEMRVISLTIVPTGGEAAGSAVPDSAILFAEDELLPLLVTG